MESLRDYNMSSSSSTQASSTASENGKPSLLKFDLEKQRILDLFYNDEPMEAFTAL